MKFSYTGYDRSGGTVSATIDAPDLNAAREQLRRQSIFASKIEPLGNPIASKHGKSKGLSTAHRLRGMAMFSRQLQVLVASGTPLVQALGAVERQCEHPAWRAVIIHMREKIEEGSPLSETMRQHPAFFDSISTSLVAAGEASGNLPMMLDRLAVLSRKQLALRSMIIGAMIYPMVLISIGFSALITMIMFVLPRFTELFASLDSPLPPTTKILLWMSGILWGYWWAILAAIVVAGLFLKFGMRGVKVSQLFSSVLLHVPKINAITRSVMTARLARMLGTLLESRVALLDALHLTRDAVAHPRYVALLDTAEKAVERGEPISSVLSISDLIVPCVQETLRNGEASGALGGPLLHMADFLDEENDVIVKALTSILEPVILLVLGVLVGIIAISMFLPMFDLVSAASKG